MSLNDKVVLVTGAARGIGEGIARCFAARGARVVLTDLDQQMVDDTATAIADAHRVRTLGLVADAASQTEMAAAIEGINRELGTLDVLVNNAGIGGLNMEFEEVGDASPLLSMSDEAWDDQLKYNLRTAFSSSHAAIPRMNDGGSIINIASIAGLSPNPMLPAYAAAKAAVIHLTGTMALELAPRQIRVNCICPGVLWTRAWEMLTAQMQNRDPELANVPQRQIFDQVISQMVPMGGEQTPEDIGQLAVFLASEEARMITGQFVSVDGGISLARQ